LRYLIPDQFSRKRKPHEGHFYWPELDVDLTVEIIDYPERFPLKAK
jgi:hypothetical protein